MPPTTLNSEEPFIVVIVRDVPETGSSELIVDDRVLVGGCG